jgi:hypothetical protein
MTDQLWTDERIDEEADNCIAFDLSVGVAPSVFRLTLVEMRNEYEQALTNHKAIIVKQAHRIAELERALSSAEEEAAVVSSSPLPQRFSEHCFDNR